MAQGLDEDAVTAQYVVLQQLLPGELMEANALAMGQTYEQLDRGETGRLGRRGEEAPGPPPPPPRWSWIAGHGGHPPRTGQDGWIMGEEATGCKLERSSRHPIPPRCAIGCNEASQARWKKIRNYRNWH